MTEHRTVSITARVTDGGRIVIPAAFRKALEIEPGDEVVLEMEDDTMRILSRKLALKRLREMVASVVTPGESFVDEFIRERNKEWRGEET